MKTSLKYCFVQERQEHGYSQTAKAAYIVYIVYLPLNLLVNTNINEVTWKQQQQQNDYSFLKKIVKCSSQLLTKVESPFWFTVVST